MPEMGHRRAHRATLVYAKIWPRIARRSGADLAQICCRSGTAGAGSPLGLCGKMTAMHRIVVDAMGGDHAPDEIVQGAAEASLALAGAEIILVGDAAAIGRLLPNLRHDGARVRVHHAPTHIEMDEKPAEALAAKPDASIAVAADLVARGDGDALVSAGRSEERRVGKEGR